MASFNNGGKAKEFIFFHNRRKIINLYKQYLFLLEDLKQDYNIPDEIYEETEKEYQIMVMILSESQKKIWKNLKFI